MDADFAKLQEARRPLFKKLTMETVDKSSALYAHYLKDTLTEDVLKNSCEDTFTVAFYYNHFYDIMDYLRHLRTIEITGVLYNTMKHYLKGRSVDDVTEITKKTPSVFSTKCLSALKGEMYRINGWDIMECPDLFDEYAVFGAMTIHTCLTPDFERLFAAFVPRHTGIIGLCDLQEPRVQSAIAENIAYSYDHLVEHNSIYDIIGHIGIAQLSPGQIVSLCCDRKLATLPRNRRDACAEAVFNEVLRMCDMPKFIAVALELCTDFRIVPKIAGRILEKLSAVYLPTADGYLETMVKFRKTIFYHDRHSEHLKDTAITDFIAAEAREYAETNSMNALLADIIASKSDVHRQIELYAIYAHLAQKASLAIDDILELPEKFFVLGLDIINTRTAQLLKEFNQNLIRDRVKERIAKEIDQDTLAKFLIKRRISFRMDLSGYTSIMCDRYKQIYAQNDIAWAAANISELNKIGMPRALCTLLSKSEYKECLDGLEINCIVDSMCADAHSVSTLYSEDPQELEMRLRSMKNTKFNWKSDVVVKRRRVGGTESSAEDDACVIAPTGTNTILAALYDRIKSGDPDASDELAGISTRDEYFYIISSLFSWTQDSRHLAGLAGVFRKTVGSYGISYADYKDLIAMIVQKLGDYEVLVAVASACDYRSLQSLIADYPNNADIIASGIEVALAKSTAEESCNGAKSSGPSRCSKDIVAIVRSLVFSGRNEEILVGAKSFFYLINLNPEFNLEHLLDSTSDLILREAVRALPAGSHNEMLLKMIFTRGVLDDITALIIAKLDLDTISQVDRNRIYSMFYIAPMNYIQFELHKYGFAMNETIAIELITVLSTTYDRDSFGNVTAIMAGFNFTDACFYLMIQKLETRNILFKKWALGYLAWMRGITLAYFVKLCSFVANETSLDILEAAVKAILKIYENMDVEMRNQVSSIIEKWSESRKLARLVRRVYPLSMAKEKWYFELLRNCQDEEEVDVLCSVYRLERACGV